MKGEIEMKIGDRIQTQATLVGEFKFTKTFGWNTVETTIYKMEDAEGRIFVWKTTASLGIDSTDKRGHWVWDGVKRRDSFEFKATVKGVGEYKGEKQIELQRVKVLSIDHAPTVEEIRANKRQAQLDAMEEGDILYRCKWSAAQEHYADCEVLEGSYDKLDNTVQVIVPANRMKASGVRFKHFERFVFVPKGQVEERYPKDFAVYRAVDEEHAYRHLLKDHPDCAAWVCKTAYR